MNLRSDSKCREQGCAHGKDEKIPIPTPEMAYKVAGMQLGREDYEENAKQDPFNAGKYMEYMTDKYKELDRALQKSR